MDLARRLHDQAARLPGKAALVTPHGEVSYARLDARADAAAAALRGLGLRAGTGAEPGDRVAILAGNGPLFVEALYGAWRAGLVAVPLNTGFTGREAREVLADADVRGLVVSAGLLSRLGLAAEPLPDGLHVLVADDPADAAAAGGEGSSAVDGVRDWDEALARAADGSGASDGPGEGALALLQYTAGTTGRPKGVMLTHGNLSANHRQMAGTALRIEEDDLVLCVLPLFHIYALNVVLVQALARGAGVLLLPRFDPTGTLREISRHRATVLVGAPPMYAAWCDDRVEAAGLDLSSVRCAVSGAASLPPAVLERFQERFGVPLWEGYGLTETAPVLTSCAAGDDPRPRAGSVGRPLPEVELRLVDEHGGPVHGGDPGEVVVRGPNVFVGYWRQPEATAQVLDDDGWFRTGDVGYAEDGLLHLVDRRDDLILVSGFNVYPREVEDVLRSHPAVAQAAVVGVEHPHSGRAVEAFVVPAAGAVVDPDALLEHCRGLLARFKVPARVTVVDALPLLPTGKVRRRDLRMPRD